MRIALRLMLAVGCLLALSFVSFTAVATAQVTPEALCRAAHCAYLPFVARPGTNGSVPSGTTATPLATPTPRPTTQPTATRVPTAVPPVNGWLAEFNAYRIAAGIRPVTENVAYSSAAAKHTNYMLLNPNEFNHGENPNLPGYTREGDEVAQRSNLYRSSPGFTDRHVMWSWMESLHHRYGMLHPNLATSGYSLACNTQGCAAILDVLGGLINDPNAIPDVAYPGDGQQGVRTSTISWHFDPFAAPIVLSAAVLRDQQGNIVPTTTVLPNGYFNLVALRAVTPLPPNASFTVDMTVVQGGKTVQKRWSFRTAP